MKILLKEKIMQMLSSMEEAHTFLSANPEAGPSALLADCQNAALRIGNLLEASEAHPEQIVAELETYCELIYQLSICPGEQWEAYVQRLTEQIKQIASQIENQVSTEKLKAIFLPYSASMWDAFDSVYAAAVQDERFDVKVIPIPYYSLDARGEIQQAHYEGAELGKLVPVTDYRTYSIPLELPDVIFIHNPYDGCNRVTRVFEQFYSSALIQYTQHLVYIPYYVSRDRMMPHFAQMPGVQNAWRIFTENERIRKQYIDGGIAPEKVAALGSPKMDMVLRAARAEKQIPEEWQVLKNKRVFFYNTALTDILNHRECFLQKVQFVIETFQKHPELALLWRPHPLSVSTMESMAPELLQGYQNIVKEFKDSGIGVYDETGDLERTITISDGYIGDLSSSVSRLYEATGKPCFYVEYWDDTLKRPTRYARCLCAAIWDRKIYMYAWGYNALFVLDEEKNRLLALPGDESMPVSEQTLYSKCVIWKNFIYFIPLYAHHILKYDLIDGRRTRLAIDLGDHHFDIVLDQERLYLLPMCYAEHYIAIDLNTDEIEYIPTNYHNQLSGVDPLEQAPLFHGEVLIHKKVWRCCRAAPILQCIDLQKRMIEYTDLPEMEEPLREFVLYKNCFWGIGLNTNRIYQWDPEKNKIKRLITIDKWAKWQERHVFHHIRVFKDFIWVFLLSAPCVLRIDPATGQVKFLEFGHLQGLISDQYGKFLFSDTIQTEKEYIYLFPRHINGIVKINAETSEITLIKTEMECGQLQKIMSGPSFNENMCTLEEFLKSQNGHAAANIDHPAAGERIWEYIVQNID